MKYHEFLTTCTYYTCGPYIAAVLGAALQQQDSTVGVSRLRAYDGKHSYLTYSVPHYERYQELLKKIKMRLQVFWDFDLITASLHGRGCLCASAGLRTRYASFLP